MVIQDIVPEEWAVEFLNKWPQRKGTDCRFQRIPKTSLKCLFLHFYLFVNWVSILVGIRVKRYEQVSRNNSPEKWPRILKWCPVFKWCSESSNIDRSKRAKLEEKGKYSHLKRKSNKKINLYVHIFKERTWTHNARDLQILWS